MLLAELPLACVSGMLHQNAFSLPRRLGKRLHAKATEELPVLPGQSSRSAPITSSPQTVSGDHGTAQCLQVKLCIRVCKDRR